MTPTLDAPLLSSSREGADLGRTLVINPILLGPGTLQWELRHNLSITEQSIHHTQWDSLQRSPERTLQLNARVAP